MKSRAEALREQGDPLIRRAAQRANVKLVAHNAGISYRHAKRLRSDEAPSPELGWSKMLALAPHDSDLRAFIAQAIGIDPLDSRRRAMFDTMAKMAAAMMEEGDQEQ